MPALFAVMSTWQLEKLTTQLQEIQDTQRVFPVRAHTDYMCAPYIPDTRLETYGRYYLYMRLDSLRWLDACVWPDFNEN